MIPYIVQPGVLDLDICVNCELLKKTLSIEDWVKYPRTHLEFVAIAVPNRHT
jgi:hypothetical protein